MDRWSRTHTQVQSLFLTCRKLHVKSIEDLLFFRKEWECPSVYERFLIKYIVYNLLNVICRDVVAEEKYTLFMARAKIHCEPLGMGSKKTLHETPELRVRGEQVDETELLVNLPLETLETTEELTPENIDEFMVAAALSALDDNSSGTGTSKCTCTHQLPKRCRCGSIISYAWQKEIKMFLLLRCREQS